MDFRKVISPKSQAASARRRAAVMAFQNDTPEASSKRHTRPHARTPAQPSDDKAERRSLAGFFSEARAAGVGKSKISIARLHLGF